MADDLLTKVLLCQPHVLAVDLPVGSCLKDVETLVASREAFQIKGPGRAVEPMKVGGPAVWK